jgi:hypothetical protein
MADQLKPCPCPFCGSRDLGTGGQFVQCFKCGTFGPSKGHVKAWNRRDVTVAAVLGFEAGMEEARRAEPAPDEVQKSEPMVLYCPAGLRQEWNRIKRSARDCGVDYNLPDRVEDAFRVLDEVLPAPKPDDAGGR